jgi:membrane protein
MMEGPPVPDAPRPGTAPATPEQEQDEWAARVARSLVVLPPRLRPPLAWVARRWVGRLLGRTMAGLVRVQIFDRSMTLAAQMFTSIFPLLILLAALVGGGTADRLADWAGLPQSSRNVLDDALSHSGLSAFGVVGSVVVLVSSTGLARALARAYAAVWAVSRPPTGPRASWRWLATVLTLAVFAVATRLLAGITGRLPLPHISSAVLLWLADCGLAVLLPWLLLGGGVSVRALAPGGVIFGLFMLVVRPTGSVYLPRALQTSSERYGTIGVAFTYIGWLYVLAFCLLLAAILGHVVTQDEGMLGRLVRGGAGQVAVMRRG